MDSLRDLRTAQLKGTRARLLERRVKPLALSSGKVCQFRWSMYDLKAQLAEVNGDEESECRLTWYLL